MTIERHPELGFGFVAGSSRPVLVRFVKEGGPSEGVVHAGDQILAINGIDVAQSPRDQVIDLIKYVFGSHRFGLRQCFNDSLISPTEEARTL